MARCSSRHTDPTRSRWASGLMRHQLPQQLLAILRSSLARLICSGWWLLFRPHTLLHNGGQPCQLPAAERSGLLCSRGLRSELAPVRKVYPPRPWSLCSCPAAWALGSRSAPGLHASLPLSSCSRSTQAAPVRSSTSLAWCHIRTQAPFPQEWRRGVWRVPCTPGSRAAQHRTANSRERHMAKSQPLLQRSLPKASLPGPQGLLRRRWPAGKQGQLGRLPRSIPPRPESPGRSGQLSRCACKTRAHQNSPAHIRLNHRSSCCLILFLGNSPRPLLPSQGHPLWPCLHPQHTLQRALL